MRGVYRTLVDAATWDVLALRVGSAEAAHGAREKRPLIELLQRSSRLLFSVCDEERNFECTGGLWRPILDNFALLARVLCTVVMYQARNRLITSHNGRTQKFRFWPLCRCNRSALISHLADVALSADSQSDDSVSADRIVG